MRMRLVLQSLEAAVPVKFAYLATIFGIVSGGALPQFFSALHAGDVTNRSVALFRTVHFAT